MTTINKKRSGDENIGKLIVFAITIVIAIGLVGLVSFFYTENRQVAVNTAVLSSTNSNSADIVAVLANSSATDACTASGSGFTIDFNAISNLYTLENVSTGEEAGCTARLNGLKGINNAAAGTLEVTYSVN